MKCIDFEDRLNDLLDERRAPQSDATLMGHAALCADCRELLAGHDCLFRGLAVLNHGTASPELGKRVMSELNAPALVPPLPPAPRRSWIGFIATAAAVLIVVGLGIVIANRGGNNNVARNQGPRNDGNGLALGHLNRPLQPLPTKEVKPSREAVVVQPQQLPPAHTPEEAEALRQMVSIASWSNTAQWPQVETLNVGQVEQYAPGIRPIRESFEVAIDALLRTIPSGKKDTNNTPPQAIQPYGGMIDLA